MPPSQTVSAGFEHLATAEYVDTGAATTPSAGPPRLVLEAGFELVILAAIGAAIATTGLLPLTWCGATIAALSYALVAILVVAGLGRHAPHRSFGPANAITLSRAAFDVALLAIAAEQALGSGSVLGPGFRWGLTIAAGAALVLDGVDGWAARRTHMTSPFGVRFDMEADALFLLGLTLVLIAGGIVGPWVLASGVTYYLFRVAGRLWPVLAGPLFRSRRRKVIFGAQAILLISAIAPVLPPWAAQLLCLGGTTLLLYSFLVDIFWLLGWWVPGVGGELLGRDLAQRATPHPHGKFGRGIEGRIKRHLAWFKPHKPVSG
jgi:phosphatidylglycerophosphate synthase